MPLLKCGKELSPPNFFDLAGSDFPWWIAHTRSRQEKAFARQMHSQGIPYYLPHREKRSRRSGRTFVSYLPLFPGYVFFRGPVQARHAALGSHLLVRVLDVLEPELLSRELHQIRSLQESGASLVPLEALEPGDTVRVLEGPFQGYSGVIVRGRTRLRLIVAITMLRKAVAVEFERDVLVPSGRRAGSGLVRTAVA